MPELFGVSLGGIEIFLMSLGVGALVLALRISRELSFGGLRIPAPTGTFGRLAWSIVGVSLIATAWLRAEPVWAPTVAQELVWSGAGDRTPEQLVTDGDEIYVLVRNGNIFRIETDDALLIDHGTGTHRIASAGGVLFVLKDDGNIWSVLLHERTRIFESPDGLNVDNTGAAPDLRGTPTFRRIDSGTSTDAIAVAGEALYILKTSGRLWRFSREQLEPRYEALPEEEPLPAEVVAGEVPGEVPSEPYEPPRFRNVFLELDTPPIDQIASSGTVLYYRTRVGDVGALFLQPEAHESGLAKDVDEALASCGKATDIAVDGRRVYLIDLDGNLVSCLDGDRSVLFHAVGERRAEQVRAFGGVAYLLTNDDEILRLLPGEAPRQYRAPSVDGTTGIDSITPAVYGCYAIDDAGVVWRFSEHLRRQR